MKITLLFLVLVNLLFFGWSHWVAKPPGAALVATPEPSAERLILFAEAYPDEAAEELDVTTLDVPNAENIQDAEEPSEPVVAVAEPPAEKILAPTPVAEDVPGPEPEPEIETETEPAPETLSAAVDVTPRRCVQLGPFLRLREATEAAAKLRESDLHSSQRLEESEIWVGHWVYLPAFPSRPAAIAEVERLRAGGITDNYIEPSGELRNTISLGLFSDRARAEARANEARELGASPEVGDRFRNGTVYWLEFDMAADQELDVAEFSAKPSRPVELKDRICEPSAG